MMIKYNKQQVLLIADYLFKHNKELVSAIKADRSSDIFAYLISTLKLYSSHASLPAWMRTAGVVFTFNKQIDDVYLADLSAELAVGIHDSDISFSTK